MATQAIKGSQDEQTDGKSLWLDNTQLRYAWLGLGALASLFSVGGRWDVALAAWLAPLFLLRFTRVSGALTGIAMAWLVAVASALFWNFQLGVPFQGSTIAAGMVFATFFTLPYLLDRLLVSRLGLAGRLFVFPAAIAASEFLLGSFSPLGTAYGMRAITQTEYLSLLQVVSIVGPYGIGFLIGWLATTANWIWENPGQWNDRRVGGAFLAVLVAAVVGGALRIGFTPTPASYVTIAGLSPDVELHKNIREMIGDTREEMAQSDQAELQTASRLSADGLVANTRRAAAAGAQGNPVGRAHARGAGAS